MVVFFIARVNLFDWIDNFTKIVIIEGTRFLIDELWRLELEFINIKRDTAFCLMDCCVLPILLSLVLILFISLLFWLGCLNHPLMLFSRHNKWSLHVSSMIIWFKQWLLFVLLYSWYLSHYWFFYEIVLNKISMWHDFIIEVNSLMVRNRLLRLWIKIKFVLSLFNLLCMCKLNSCT